MQEWPNYMYGYIPLIERPKPVMTVLLVGFQGQRRVLTGTFHELNREFMVGDGGHGCNQVQPCGWEYWCEQPLGTRERDAKCSCPIENIIAKKG
jgi:hypothetical protein